MSILIFLIPFAMFLGLAGLLVFIWTMKNKQYEDLEGSAQRILFDDLRDQNIKISNKKIKKKTSINS